MNYFLEAINHPIEAFKNKSKAVSWSFVALTVLINTVFEPILAWTAVLFIRYPIFIGCLLQLSWVVSATLSYAPYFGSYARLSAAKHRLKPTLMFGV